MNAQQEVLETGRRPRRRPVRTLLLVSAPVALAATVGLVAANVVPAPEVDLASDTAGIDTNAREVALVEQAPTATSTNVMAAVVAPTLKTDAKDSVPQIEVSFPPEPEPELELQNPVRASQSGSNSSGNKSSASKSSGGKKAAPSAKSSGSSKSAPAKKKASQSFESYCASPSTPYGAGSMQGLLSAANKERARIGIAPMSWSGSLASAATSWSKSMASKDKEGKGGALAHNPNRPGAENVGATGSSAGMSTGTAAGKVHSGWMYSNGHCRNVMNPAYSSMGAGAATTSNGNTVYITANFR